MILDDVDAAAIMSECCGDDKTQNTRDEKIKVPIRVMVAAFGSNPDPVVQIRHTENPLKILFS